MTSKRFGLRRKPSSIRIVLIGLALTGVALRAQAQQGPDDDPDVAHGYVNNVFHHSSVDSINLYNGSLSIPVAIGPAYPVGSKLKYQAILVYGSRVWEFGSPNPTNYPPDGQVWTQVVGDPALGIGWTFLPGAIKTCGQFENKVCYIGQDGAEHKFEPPGTGAVKSPDASQLILKGNDTSGYEMWDGDGNHYVFQWHVHGYDDKANPWPGDPIYNYITDLGRGRDGWYLTSLSDPFGKTVSFTYYSGLGALPCWNPATVRCSSTDLPNSWIPYQISGPSWTITVNLDASKRILNFVFPTNGTSSATWSLGYGTMALNRNPPNAATFTATTLASLTLPTASYAFEYDSGDTANKGGPGGLIKKMTLPTGGVISYVWRLYSFYHGRRAGLLNCEPVPPLAGEPVLISHRPPQTETEGPVSPETPEPAISGCVPGQTIPEQFRDQVQGVARRTETLGTQKAETDYVQLAFPVSRKTLTLTIFPPGIEGPTRGVHATATLFWGSASNDGTVLIGDRTGADLETRVFDFDPWPYFAVPDEPAISDPPCGSGSDNLFCPNHAVRVTQRVFDYDSITAQCCNRRVSSETTYMQATDVLGSCIAPCKYRSTAYSPSSTWESNGRHYTTEVRSGDLGSGVQTRTITTTWTPVNWSSGPPAGSSILQANIYNERDTTDGSRTIKRFFEFDTANGFLKGQLTWDLAQQTAYANCRYEELDGQSNPTGNATSDLLDSFSSTGQPSSATSYCTVNYPPGTSVGQDQHKFGKKYTYQNGQLLTARWVNGTLPATWYTRQYTRDTRTGWITDSFDTSSVKTHYDYDTLGRVTAITPDGETATSISYDLPTQTTVTRSGGTGLSTWQQYQYDGLGRLIRERKTIAGGATVKRFTLFDLTGHDYFHSEWVANAATELLTLDVSTTCKYTNSYNVEANYTTFRPSAASGTFKTCFDPFGRPQKVVGAKHNSIQTIYRTDTTNGTSFHGDSLETVTNYCVNGYFTGATCNGTGPLNPITTTKRDPFGRMFSVTEPSGDLTTYGYDVNDKLASVTQTPQIARSFIYDAGGFLKSESTPEKGAVSYTYGGLGNVMTESDPGPLTVTRSYDFAGRLTTVVAGTQTFVSNCYDGTGSCSGTGGTYKAGKLTRRIGYNFDPSGGSTGSVTQDFTYSDPTGRLSQRSTTFSTGVLTTLTEKWAYNSLGLVSNYWHPRLSGATPFVVSTVYDQGLPVAEYLNGVPMVKSVSYMNSGALASYTTGLGTGSDVATTITQDASQLPRPGSISTTGASVNWSSGSYLYDGAGDVVNIGSDQFSYDDRSRLLSATLSGIGSQYFCYDRWGNRVAKGTSPLTCSSYSPWSNNRVPPGTTNYDARGNMISNGSETYSYDSLDRQIRHVGSTTWNYLHDAAGERVVKKPPTGDWTYTLRDESNRISTEYAGSSPTPVFSRDQVYLGNLLVAAYANTAVGGNAQAWQFSSSDHLGSPRLITDIAGAKLDGPRYWPYGEEAVVQVGPQRVRFAAMERDTEASRYFDHARNHEFNLGRFLSPDKLQGKILNPQSWNRYAYAGNNPLKYVDPNGREIRLAGDVRKALGDTRQLVPAADRSSIRTITEGGVVRLDASALAAHKSSSGNFAMLTRLATTSKVVEVDTSSQNVATTSNEIKKLGNFTAPADYKNPEGFLGIMLGPSESTSGNIHVQVNPFLSGMETAGSLGHELVHADFETRGLDPEHSVDTGKPNQALEFAIKRAFDEAIQNFEPFLAR
jgi:RHS repeat-associated protein